MDFLLSPPIAFGLYLLLVGALSLVGKWLAGNSRATPLAATTYASGEAPPTGRAAPGYRPYFVTTLFFAVLHLGVLVMATGLPGPAVALYALGLLVVLIALSLG